MKIALVHNWPGQKNSELELIKRIIRVAGGLGHRCTVIDPLGHILNSEGEHCDPVEFIDWSEYDFCLNLHYVNPNIFDTFSYAANWNPLDYVVRHPMDGSDLPADHIAYRTACLESHDALLGAGSEEMDDFAASLNLVSRQQIVNSSLYLHTTSDVSKDFGFPDFRDFRVFYIGANWERQEGKSRHRGLIRRLDETNIVDFYGVREQHGLFLWEGIRNYKGELPFDGGRSILEESNRCGVSLVLHSRSHRKSELVSTRIFQACAARTVTICDDNPFILKYFGSSVLSFEYRDDPAENFHSIMEKVKWIRRHPCEAVEMAREAHRIFMERFSLQREITNLFDSHEANVAQYFEKFCASDASRTVDVLYMHRGGQDSALENFFDDLEKQIRIRPLGIVFTLPCCAGEVQDAISRRSLKCRVIECDGNLEGELPLDGRLVAGYLQTHAESLWFTIYNRHCRWKRLHLTQLVRASEGGAPVTMSGTFIKGKAFFRLVQEYYLLLMNSINGHPRGITTRDLGGFAAGRFPSSSMLFTVSSFQDQNLLCSLRFFDKGWAFFLVIWNYLQMHELPLFVPKLTTVFVRSDDQWKVDTYIDGKQTEEFERSLALSFFKNDPYYLSIGGGTGSVEKSGKSGGAEKSERFSLNEYIHDILRFRPLLLKMYISCFRILCFFFGLPYKKPEK